MERRRNASSPDEKYQQQQQQANATLETHLGQQQQQSPSPQLASEPNRRRNAPIDIDTALRLQAQANLVQEPASAASSAASSARSRCELESLGLTQQAAAATGLVLGQRQREQSGTPRSSDSTSQTATTPTNNNCQASHFYDHLYISKTTKPSGACCGNNNNNNNNNLNTTSNPINFISVDYIDCLSNYDLLASPPAASVSAPANAAMRCIPSCRKHLSRFQRGHRVEPRPQDEQPQGLKEQLQLQQNQADSSGDSNSLVAASNRTNTSADSSSLLLASGSLDGGDLMDQSQRRHANSESVLYPIPISEAKKRTYFIGSVSQDSLLSHDELHRYFPNGRISIFACTWNQNRKRAPINLDDLLLPERLVYMPDIYAIGIQEAYSSQQDYLREWEIELQTTLGPNHVMLHSCALGALHLALFIRRDLIWFCSTPEESLYNSRSMPTNMIKTKGAISIAFRFFGTSFMFTNCHFPAHENKIKDRIDEYQRIRNSIDLPKNLKLLKPRYLSNDSTARFDCVFFMGDLNFRLEQRTFEETIQILEDIFQSKEPTFEALTQNDELLKVMESQQAFHGFDEAQIKFPPTYKFLAQTNKYDRQTKRVPSYTDRILFRSKRQRHIQCLIYDWLPQLISSDHKPVYGLFDVLIRPGHERNMVSSLNAGLFHRAVYIEALKRRAEGSDGLRENGVGGNLICSIS